MDIESLKHKVDYHYKMYLYYSEKLAELREPKDEISQAECSRIASLIGKNRKQ